MAGRIREEDIQAVRERTNLAEVVGGYLTLKKSGRDALVGLCPFHAEKTPSFSVSPSKGVYYCFGCGEGGDAVTFLRKVENLTFAEAVERLAQVAGVRLRYEGGRAGETRESTRRRSLYQANEEAARLFHETLTGGREGAEARAYLVERGLHPETIERFWVGYAPVYPDFLLRRLSKQFGAEVLVEAGLVAKGAEGGLRDRFRGRVTFPVRDLSGRFVGFGARALPGSTGAKYLNSSESPVYRKGSLLYNLDRAKAAISRLGVVYVVEGYTDVLALVQAGVDPVVATCGTSLTEEHVRLLGRFARRAVLTFDADEAGARAAERAYAFHEAAPVELDVLILPGGKDPADFVTEHGSEGFLDAGAGARPLVEYMIRRVVDRGDLGSVEGRSRAVAAALPVIEGLRDPVRRQQYAHLLAELAGVSEESVFLKLQAVPGARRSQQGPRRSRLPVQERVEREMLRLLVQVPDVAAEVVPGLGPDHFQSHANRAVFEVLRSTADVRSLAADESDLRRARLISQLTLEPLEGDPTTRYARTVRNRLHELLLRRKSGELRRRLQQLNPATDPGYDEMFEELVSLDAELRRLQDEAGVPTD